MNLSPPPTPETQDALRSEPDAVVRGALTASGGKITSLDRWLLRQGLRRLRQPPLRLVLWNGEEFGPSAGQASFTLRIRDRAALWRLLTTPDLGFGDGYSDGTIVLEGELIPFLEMMYRLTNTPSPLPPLWKLVNRLRGNTLSKAKANIYHHYDIGNDFYKLWLDDQLVYTCAYYPAPDATLEQAQFAKMDHVCRKVRLRPGQTVIEAGCGWGSLARHMARHYGVKVRAFNISHEQIAYARERARAEGLDNLVEYVEDDYRNITGTCDAFVSVGMLEHVGLERYRQLGNVIRRCLAPHGLGLVHSIGRNFPSPTNTWLQKRIFPGAHIPALGEMLHVLEPWDLTVLDVENLRLHYARTLEHWLERFEAVADRVETMFDARFVRMWRLYLAGSLAGFTSGTIQLFQIVFSPSANRDIPWTRDFLYATPSKGTE
jgi:cyclopropane-fatty-acyl-phospholipid synthase